jgi:F1F0 ATPase subunit 2
MNEIFVFIAGSILGIIFFGGLWFTVNNTISAKYPGLWIFGSFILRTIIVMTGFYFLSLGDWKRLLISTFGFIVARFILAYIIKPKQNRIIKIEGGINRET